MTRRAALALLVLCLVASAASCSGGDDASGGSDRKIPFVDVDPDSARATDKAIRDAQAKLRADPEDQKAKLELARGYIQKARETGEAAFYAGADTLLADLAETGPPDVRVITGQGSLALSRHEFRKALSLGRRGLEVAPGNETAYGVVVDALNELGRYPAALEATQAMVDVRPGLAALARVSYARELRGDLDGAIEAMTQAVTASGAAGGENLAFVQVQLGHLLLTRGDAGQAAKLYADAEQSFPGYPAAKVGQARVLVAQERFGAAADLLGQAVEVLPFIEYAVAHAEALEAAGRADEATEAYALVQGIEALQKESGVDTGLDVALFEAEQSPGPASVARARRAVEARPSILGHDALAWNLFRADDIGEAADEIEKALVTGTDDPLIRYHAAEITLAAGDRAAAAGHLRKVLDTNPRFSARYVDDVERLARQLGLEMPPPVSV